MFLVVESLNGLAYVFQTESRQKAVTHLKDHIERLSADCVEQYCESGFNDDDSGVSGWFKSDLDDYYCIVHTLDDIPVL